MADRQIYQLTGRALSLTDVIPSQDTAGAAEAGKSTLQVLKDLLLPYKVYTALITQTSTSAPTAVIMENTLGGTVVLTRSSAGVYVATLAAAFTVNKTFIPNNHRMIDNPPTIADVINIERTDANSISIITLFGGTPTDALLTSAPLEIRVYN